jgi:lysozyme family protein
MFSRLDILGFWRACTIQNSLAGSVASQVMNFQSMYQEVQSLTAVPWYVVGGIDYREESFNHNGYLGNGDPLDRVTTNVPRGRGPFTNWQSGAIDAFQISGWDRLPTGAHWDIVTALMKCEAYNGEGYAHMGIRSPYVWAGTNMQQRGMYTADGAFDPTAWDTRLGVAAIFLVLKQSYSVDLNEA